MRRAQASRRCADCPRTSSSPTASRTARSPKSSLRRPREGGDPVAFLERRWIPAFAGMTKRLFLACELAERELQRRGEMRVRLVVAAEPREQLAERDVRRVRVVEREARLEIGLRLAP